MHDITEKLLPLGTPYVSFDEPEATILLLDEVDAILDGLFTSQKRTEQTLQCLQYIKTSNPALYALIEQETSELATLPGAQYLGILNGEAYYLPNNASAGISHRPLIDAIPEVCVDGVLKHPCLECGKLYDRKARANDCQNLDLGIKPYKCAGRCSNYSCDRKYASRELLVRHCENVLKGCPYCSKKIVKQNINRHLRSCTRRSSPQVYCQSVSSLRMAPFSVSL